MINIFEKTLRTINTKSFLLQPLKVVFRTVGQYSLVANITHNRLERVLVGLAAKKYDLMTRLAVIYVGVQLVTIFT